MSLALLFVLNSTMTDPAGVGVTLLRITIVMLVLSWSTVVARLSVRRWLKPEAMGMDDYMMCVGLVCAYRRPSRPTKGES